MVLEEGFLLEYKTGRMSEYILGDLNDEGGGKISGRDRRWVVKMVSRVICSKVRRTATRGAMTRSATASRPLLPSRRLRQYPRVPAPVSQ